MTEALKICPACKRRYPMSQKFCSQDATLLDPLELDEDDPLIGQLLDGRWRITHFLGEGGMGRVYSGVQEKGGREVAIKTLKASFNDGALFTERFLREAKTTMAINHPHCVTVYDFGESEGGMLYLAMEYLDGKSLEEHIVNETLSLLDVLEVAKQITSALGAAHAEKIVHRDLKPANVFLVPLPDGNFHVKVLDFGIAKVLEGERQLTQAGQVFGTPEFMSPEQCMGKEVDGRSDLYALGCVIYTMLSGHPPFEGSALSILRAQVHDEMPPIELPSGWWELPRSFSELLHALMAKSPEDRPPSALVVHERLEEILLDIKTGLSSGETSEHASIPEAEKNEGLRKNASRTGKRVSTKARISSFYDVLDKEVMGPPTLQPKANTKGSEAMSSLFSVINVLMLVIAGIAIGIVALMYFQDQKEEGQAQEADQPTLNRPASQGGVEE